MRYVQLYYVSSLEEAKKLSASEKLVSILDHLKSLNVAYVRLPNPNQKAYIHCYIVHLKSIILWTYAFLFCPLTAFIQLNSTPLYTTHEVARGWWCLALIPYLSGTLCLVSAVSTLHSTYILYFQTCCFTTSVEKWILSCTLKIIWRWISNKLFITVTTVSYRCM